MTPSHNRRLPALALPLVLLALVLPSGAAAASGSARDVTAAELPRAQPAEVGLSSERLERLDRAMRAYVERREVAGVVTLVARRGKVAHLVSHGLRDFEAKAPMTDDTIFRIASMTKPVASAALMMLWEEGKFQLRDPVSEYIPELSEMRVAISPAADEYWGQPYKTVAAARPITVQHLLTHTSGFANSYRGPNQQAYASLRSERKPGSTVGDMVKALAQLPLNFHPGDEWQYGPSTDVVGYLVEELSGQSLDEFLRQRIFEPLGMADTHFYLPAEKLERFAALYRPGDDGGLSLTEAPTADSRYVREPHTYFSGGGGLVSTAADYFRFHQMMLNGGELDGVRLLGSKTVELMTSNHTGDLGIWLRGPGYGFGLGYSVVTDLGPSAMPASPGSYSWGGAFGTVFWVDPVEELIGIFMTQIRPYTHLNIRQDMQVLTYQAIVD